MSGAAKKTSLEDLQELIRRGEESRIKGEESLREAQKKTEESLRGVHESQKKTEKSLRRLEDLFTGQWGKLMESLVKGDLIRLLNERKIEVGKIAREHECKWNGKDYEFDIIAVNGEEIVVVEVKTTLRLKDVDYFIEKLKDFKNIFREYADKKILGAVAYLKANEGMAKYSEKKGLFVIRATGSSASITNSKDFEPKVF